MGQFFNFLLQPFARRPGLQKLLLTARKLLRIVRLLALSLQTPLHQSRLLDVNLLSHRVILLYPGLDISTVVQKLNDFAFALFHIAAANTNLLLRMAKPRLNRFALFRHRQKLCVQLPLLLFICRALFLTLLTLRIDGVHPAFVVLVGHLRRMYLLL